MAQGPVAQGLCGSRALWLKGFVAQRPVAQSPVAQRPYFAYSGAHLCAYLIAPNMVKRGVPEMIINIGSIGTPSEKLRPNPIWAQISHWKCNGWGTRGLFVKGKYGKLLF